MDAVVIGLILTVWICLVLPAVVIQFLPRNPESQPQRAPRRTGLVPFMSSKSQRDTNGGKAVA